MTTHRYTILTWKDPVGQFTAALLEAQKVAAIGSSAAQASDQLLEYLRWIYRQEPWRRQPDLHNPELMTIAVEVRPEYRVKDRVFPSSHTVRLEVPCVLGARSSDVRACIMPTIMQGFHFNHTREVKLLVTQYVQRHLSGLAPREVSRFAPPAELALAELVVKARKTVLVAREAASTVELELVANPLDGRKKLSGRGRKKSGSGARAWGRDGEVTDLIRRLGEERTSLVLMGDSGVGKSTLLRDAIRRIRAADKAAGREQSTGTPTQHRFWQTSGARLIAGMKYLGQWQARCERVIDELSIIDGVLCIENLTDLVHVGGQGPGDSVGAFLVPYLQRGELRIVAEATPAEMDACRRLLPALADAVVVLRVESFSREQSIAVLNRISENITQLLGVEVEEGATRQIYRLFNRFMPYQSFPGRPGAFLKDLFDRVSRRDGQRLTVQSVVERFTQITGLPQRFLRDEVALSRDQILSELHQSIVGQDAACQAVTDLILTFKSALNDPHRPIGVLLFCGPTGVGKTEMAKTMASTLFGAAEKERLIRLDMSEYAGPGSAMRLLGDPYGEPSPLIRQVRQNPFVVLLLDEIEKAHHEVFDVLLSLLDEGRLTDRFGRLTTFRSAVIIMTSNLTSQAGPPFGFGIGIGTAEQGQSAATNTTSVASGDAEVGAFFRPEFYNRIDAVVNFEPLSHSTILQITRELLTKIAKREGLTAAGIQLVWGENLVEILAAQGFDARYGARPLQRVIEAILVTPLSRYLVAHPRLRNTQIRLDVRNGVVIFE